MSDLIVFEVHRKKTSTNQHPFDVSDLGSARLPPIMSEKIIFDGDRR